MKLPRDLISGIYTKPNLYLCETDKTKICRLETTEMSGSFKFNSYSELSCTISRTYTDMITGEQKINPFYDKIEALRLLYLEGFGYFEIQDPEIVSDGIQEVKNLTAFSLEYSLSQKYLEDFYINTGENNSVEVIYRKDTDGDGDIDNDDNIDPVTLYNPTAFTEYEKKHSLLHLVLEKTHGWVIGHVDASLRTMTRSFEVSRATIYDFITQDICEQFGCFVEFNTISEDVAGNKINEINFYAESPVAKFVGDGVSTSFNISPAFDTIEMVTVGGFKTTKYEYVVRDNDIGILTFEEAPPASTEANIEVKDGSQKKYSTDVYVSFDNLAQEVNVSYSAEDIKTVLTVKGADDLDIREVNMGLPYITDLSYYYSVDWMGQELYDAYTKYLQNCKDSQGEYAENSKQELLLRDKKTYEENRISLQYSIAPNVNNQTYGKYYIRGGTAPNYYYLEVTLPDEYSAEVEHYYTLSGNDLTTEKFKDFYNAIRAYYVSQEEKDVSKFDEELKKAFAFMEVNTIDLLVEKLSNASTTSDKDEAIYVFLDELWNQFGLAPLEEYKKAYGVKEADEEDGENSENSEPDPSDEGYWQHYYVTVVDKSLENEINDRKNIIESLQQQIDELVNRNTQINENFLMDVFFKNYYIEQGFDDEKAATKAYRLLSRLDPFLREDEYTDDNFVVTDADSIETSIQKMQELLECGKIELSKLCSPKLAFSMSMANIYALPEFAPMVGQFQLGNLINVAIRKDYIKRARLLQVDINFDDFSDFSCEFGELTSLRTPSSIHADLLAQAMGAGKSVASQASYWDKGAELATSTDLKIQQGLLSAVSGLYTSDQSIVIDNNGILLRKVLDDGSFSPHQAIITNNGILLSDDSFTTARTGLGEFTAGGQTFYGMLAEAVLSGYIESSKIVGGTINIGDGTFVVNSDGSVTMNAASIKGYVEKDGVISSINQSAETIAINANRISLAGKEIDLTSDDISISSTNFSVTKEGKITATSGEIAGWTIYDNLLRKELTIDNIDYQMYMQAPNGTSTTNAFAVRKKSSSDTDWDVQFAVNYAGKMTARNAHITGTIVAQDGSIAGYNIGSGGSYDNAIYKRVSGDSSDYEVGLKATSGDTDLAFYVKESTDDWESSSNTFYIRNNGQLYAKNANITGTINATAGNIGGCSISDGVLNVAAANITSGTIAAARIPNLSADKITVGVLHADRIPNISADKITVGTLNADRIPNISANKITSGTISTDRLSSSVITTDNFSSKTLSTSNLTVASGCRLGVASEYNALIRTVGDYTYIRGYGPDVHYETSFYNLLRYVVQNSSNKDIKNEIHDFDDRYDVFFDKLKPQLFRYNFEPNMGYTMGYVWQDAEQARIESGLERNDVGAITETDSVVGGKALSKQDFIALNTWQIQKLKSRVEELENRLAALEA